MGLTLRQLPELLFVTFAVWCHWRLFGAILASGLFGRARWLRVARVAGCLWTAMPLPFALPAVRGLLGHAGWPEWMRGFALAWAVSAVTLWALWPLLAPVRRPAGFDPARRRLLGSAGALLAAAPVAGTAFGIVVGRNRLGLTELEVRIEGLPPDLDGLRLVQLSDIHFGPFLPRKELRRAVDLANETRAHLAVVTGDLITLRDDFLLECLEELARLRAEAGVLGCLGNHEQSAGCEQTAKREGARMGIEILRRETRRLRFGSATLSVSGVDYRRQSRDYVRETGPLFRPGEVNILLSHNPDAFPVAASQGYRLILSGHTHGGQFTVPGLDQYLNPARLFTRYVNGLYREGDSWLFVSRGIGTVAVPARLGAPPEVALLRLCAI